MVLDRITWLIPVVSLFHVHMSYCSLDMLWRCLLSWCSLITDEQDPYDLALVLQFLMTGVPLAKLLLRIINTPQKERSSLKLDFV